MNAILREEVSESNITMMTEAKSLMLHFGKEENMNDTEKLLSECDAGTKMAVASIDEVLEKIESGDVKEILETSRKHHEKLGDKIHEKLIELGCDEKEPNPIAKGMSWMKTNMKMTSENPTAAVADLMTDGCDMGIKSLHKYKNQYSGAGEDAIKLCNRLIDIEEELRDDMKKFL